MYAGQDLVDLMTALETLCGDDFFEYDFNVGRVVPYLKISISRAQISAFPSIHLLPQTQPLIMVYYTLDFSMPVADFISAMQSACASYASASLPVWTALYNHGLTFSSFLTTLTSKVPA